MILFCALTSAGIPSTKEPLGLSGQDSKCPDGLALIPWQDGRPLTWHVTVVSTLADSYVDAAAAGSVDSDEVHGDCQGLHVLVDCYRELGTYKSFSTGISEGVGKQI
jgi:hypothetical protein